MRSTLEFYMIKFLDMKCCEFNYILFCFLTKLGYEWYGLVLFGLWCLAPLSTKYFSYIVAVTFIGWGNRSTQRKPSTCHKSMTNFTTYCCIQYTSPWIKFELTTLVVIGTDCTSNCKSNYHMITTMTAPWMVW